MKKRHHQLKIQSGNYQIDKKMNQEKTKEIIVLEKKTNQALQTAEYIVITNDDEMLKAGEFRATIKQYAKEAKEEKEKATKPLNDVLKTIRSWFAPIEDNCEKIISLVGSKMSQYTEEIEAKRRKAEKETQDKIDLAKKELEKNKISERQADTIIAKAEAKLEKAPEAITKSESFHTRIDRKVEFLDASKLSLKQQVFLIDNGYLVWNEVKGRRDALSGSLVVGVKVYEQKSFI